MHCVCKELRLVVIPYVMREKLETLSSDSHTHSHKPIHKLIDPQ